MNKLADIISCCCRGEMACSYYVSVNLVAHAVFFCCCEPDVNSQKEVCYLPLRDYNATME